LIAISTLPVNSTTLVYGTDDAGRTIHGGTDVLNRRIAAMAKTINVKPHYVRTTRQLFVLRLSNVNRCSLVAYASVAPKHTKC
jgi:hypothetical protein